MSTLFTALRTLLVMSGFVWLWSWVALQVRPWDRSLGILPAWTTTPGLLLMAAGGILALLCAGFFVVRGRGTPAPFDAPRRFVAVDPGGSIVVVGTTFSPNFPVKNAGQQQINGLSDVFVIRVQP